MDPFTPFARPRPAGGDPRVPQAAEVGKVNADGTVDVRYVRARSSRSSVPVIHGLTLTQGDRVVVVHLDEDPQSPIVLARL